MVSISKRGRLKLIRGAYGLTTILGMTLMTGLGHAGPFDYIHLADQVRSTPPPSPLPPAPSAASVPAAPTAPKHWVASQFLPGTGRWISTIDNFDGLVGGANVQGTGKDNQGNTFDWEVDVRAMQGVYIGRDGLSHRGTFGMT
jgi:hypothetical protein